MLSRAFSQRFASTSGQNPWLVPPNSAAVDGGVAMGSGASAMKLVSVYAAVRLLAGVVSGLTLQAVDETTGKPLRVQPLIIRDPFGGQNVHRHPYLPRRAGTRQLMVSLLLRGNAYAVIMDSDGPNPKLLQILSPDRVGVDVNRDTGEAEYSVDGQAVDTSRIVHHRGLTLPGSVVGMSPIEYARRTIELGMNAEEYGRLFFTQGASLKGIIEVPGDLTPENARKVKASFEATHGGLSNAHITGVLTGGAKYAPITVSPEDAQFLATRAAQTLDIAMLYGIPPHMLGQVDRTTSWGKGIEEQTLGFLKYTVRDYTDPLEDFWSSLLPDGQVARFTFDELLRPDTTARFSAYLTARNASLMTINEIRAAEGLDPVEAGDDIMAPLNSAHTTDPGYELGDPDESEVSDDASDSGTPGGSGDSK